MTITGGRPDTSDESASWIRAVQTMRKLAAEVGVTVRGVATIASTVRERIARSHADLPTLHSTHPVTPEVMSSWLAERSIDHIVTLLASDYGQPVALRLDGTSPVG